MRFELREASAWLREQLNRACLWRWEITRLPHKEDGQFDMVYAGRKAHRELAQMLLGIESLIDTRQAGGKQSRHRVLVSELPIPGSLCVPQYMRAILPLGRSLDQILATYDDKLRRNLLKQRARYSRRQALNNAEVDHAHLEMLHPYANARHGTSALQMTPEMTREYAQEHGRLDLVLLDDDVVACMLGNESIRKGKRYWVADRAGYPAAVFCDPKTLSQTNSINFHLAIEWAIENGFDYCDIGFCFARPDDGLLQWKRHRGAELSQICLKGYGYFYIRLPAGGEAQFLWDTPLFAIEGNNLTLHLGLPEGLSDDEFMTRYRQMGFGGLSKVYLHCARAPGEQLLAKLCGFYKYHKNQPVVESIPHHTAP